MEFAFASPVSSTKVIKLQVEETVTMVDASVNQVEIKMLKGSELCQAVVKLLESVTSATNTTFNHPFAAPEGMKIKSLQLALSIVRRHSVVPDEAIFTALALLQRLVDRDLVSFPDFDGMTIMFLTALCISGKLWLDVPFNTASFAMLAGLTTKQMVEFEMKFLALINWEVTIIGDKEINDIALALLSFA